MKLLIVDDDPMILELLSEIINATTTYEVLRAGDAFEALDFINGQDGEDIDCFLLDIQMPGKNGIELCREIRAIKAHRFTPVIMLTAMTEKKYVDDAYSAGANDYIKKPFEVDEITRRLTLAQERVAQQRADAERALEEVEPVRHGILDRIHIHDVDNVVDYFAIENYLGSLPKRSLFGSVALSLQVRCIDEIYAHLTAYQFNGLIQDVAEAISDTLRDFNCLISYAGYGTFVTVIEDKQLPSRGRLADEVNLRLHTIGAHLVLPDQHQVRVICGDVIRLMGTNSERIQDSLAQSASSAVRIAEETEVGLEKFWFMGQVSR